MLKLKEAKEFQHAIKAISNFISEGNFRFNDFGLSFRALDQSQVVLVDFSMKKELFEKFDLEPTLIGLDLQELNKVCRRMQPNDSLELKLNDSMLLLRIKNETEREFSLPLLDLGEEEPKIPTEEFDAIINIKAKILQEILKDSILFSSSVILSVKEKKFFIEASSAHGSFKSQLKESKNLTIKAKKDLTSKFSLNFLDGIVREADPNSFIKIELKNDAPMKLTYFIGKSEIKFYLAHMIL